MSDSDDHVPEFDELSARDRILIAAHDEFVAMGFEGARVQRIAEVSGANKALIYYYFRGKRELYLRVVSATFTVAIQSLAGITSADDTPENKMRSIVRFYVDFYARNRDFLRLLMREFANRGPTLKELLSELGKAASRSGFPEQLVAVLEQGMASGVFRPQDPRQTVISMISMCAGYFMLQPVANMFLDLAGEDKQREFIEARADAVAELLLGGIMAGGKNNVRRT